MRRFLVLFGATRRPLSDFAKRAFTPSHDELTNGLIASPMPSPLLVPAALSTAEPKMMTNPMQAAVPRKVPEVSANPLATSWPIGCK